MRNLLLQSTSLSNGFWTGVTVGVLPLLPLVGFASLFNNSYVMGLAWAVGLGLIPVIATRVYYAFMDNVAKYHRAVLTYFGTRQPGPENERGEGDLFIVDAFNMVGYVSYDMHLQTLELPPIPVETRDNTIVKVHMAIQWAPRAGSLYYYGNLANAATAIGNEVTECVRAYGITRADVDDLVEGKFTEALKRFIPEYINRRSRGQRCAVDIHREGDEFIPVWREIPDNPADPTVPWGIVCDNAIVKDYQLPENITRAGAEFAEAQANQRTAETIRKTTFETLDGLRARGVPPVAALAGAQTIATPDRTSTINVNAWAGLEPLARTVVNGVLAALGKPILTSDPSEPSSTENPGNVQPPQS